MRFKEPVIVGFISVIALFFLIFFSAKRITRSIYETGYLDACKDCYRGKMKYDLIENDDGSKTWQKVKK